MTTGHFAKNPFTRLGNAIDSSGVTAPRRKRGTSMGGVRMFLLTGLRHAFYSSFIALMARHSRLPQLDRRSPIEPCPNQITIPVTQPNEPGDDTIGLT